MSFASPATILEQAKHAWKRNIADHRRMITVYALVAFSLPLMVLAINVFLDQLLADTGGLSGIGLRSTLETIQTVLSTATQILLPFWSLGLSYNALAISRSQTVSTDNLFAGFRCWGAALRLMILRTLRYTTKILCGVFLGSLLFSVTPLSDNLLAISNALANDPAYATATAEELFAALAERITFWDMAPYYIFCIAGAALLAIPLFYRYRMSNYVLLDSQKPGALFALYESSRMMYRNASQLFKIDLKLWWYYLLLFLALLISFGDLLLPICGITLPFSDIWAPVIFSLFSSALQFALYFLFGGQIETIYACVYTSLKESEGGNEPL